MVEKEYIERGEALRPFLIDYNGHRIRDKDIDNFDVTVSLRQIKKILRTIPAADVVEVRHGRWNNGYEVQNCSECGYRGKRSYKYCPNCGAKMDGGANDG